MALPDGMLTSHSRVISERTKAALRAAKARGIRLGNPRLAKTRDAINSLSKAKADSFATSLAPMIREVQAAGARTLREIAAALNNRGTATARGGRWEAQTVANLLRRIR